MVYHTIYGPPTPKYVKASSPLDLKKHQLIVWSQEHVRNRDDSVHFARILQVLADGVDVYVSKSLGLYSYSKTKRHVKYSTLFPSWTTGAVIYGSTPVYVREESV